MQQQPRGFDRVRRKHEDFAGSHAFAAVPTLEADGGDAALGADFDFRGRVCAWSAAPFFSATDT